MYTSAEIEISRHLQPGESLIWTGVPQQGLIFRTADVFLIPFSILWCGFAVFWETGVLASGGPSFFALFGVPFVLIGLYFVFGRFIVDAKARANTYYGLTNRRVIILSGVFSRTTNSMPLQTLNEVSLHEQADRSGTITFGRQHPYAAYYAGMRWPGMGQYQAQSFERIPDVKRIHDQILEAQRTAT